MKIDKLVLKKCCNYSFAIVTGISTIASLLGYSIKEIFNNLVWWKNFLLLFALFVVIMILILVILLLFSHNGFKTVINGKEVEIKKGDIFVSKGLRVIPFNERFDTVVDDIIISHDSLNGIMIDKHIKDINSLNNTIKAATDEKVDLVPKKIKGKFIFPLGRIIKYDDYLMLAMTHFDAQNRAYINLNEYESMLTNMWSEIRRVYAGKKIVLPLIGSGITTMDGTKGKNNTILLKCMLCTLKRSGFDPKNGITIVLTQETIESIDIMKIKEEFKNDI